MQYTKLASAIYNDVVAGLKGFNENPSMSIKQLEDDVMDERLQIIKEYSLKGILPKNDLLASIDCISINCKDIAKCKCDEYENRPHFEIPQLITEFDGGIEYIGSINRENPFKYYTNVNDIAYHKYKRRGKDKPYVYIDVTPNENNMCDCYVYNAPLLSKITVIGVFKDLRQLEKYGYEEPQNFTFIDTEVKKRLTEKKIRYYRQFAQQQPPINNLSYD